HVPALSAYLGDGTLQFLTIVIEQCDAVAALSESGGDTAANPVGGAGHEHATRHVPHGRQPSVARRLVLWSTRCSAPAALAERAAHCPPRRRAAHHRCIRELLRRLPRARTYPLRGAGRVLHWRA